MLKKASGNLCFSNVSLVQLFHGLSYGSKFSEVVSVLGNTIDERNFSKDNQI